MCVRLCLCEGDTIILIDRSGNKINYNYRRHHNIYHLSTQVKSTHLTQQILPSPLLPPPPQPPPPPPPPFSGALVITSVRGK